MTQTLTRFQNREDCVAADRNDPLAEYRDRFSLPEGVIYLDGNSLGVLPKEAPARAAQVIAEEWGEGLVRSWNTHHWFDLPVRIGGKLARLIGGTAGECVATDTTSINVFKTLGAALDMQREDHPERRVIISERENFPSDLYVVEGMIELLDGGYELRLIDEHLTLEAALGDDVAVVLLTHANYRTGRIWDLTTVTAQVHAAGALVIWDLCHSAGAVPVALDEARADFAVGCTYKYLNGGPGSPAFVWVADRHLARARQPLSGWWGHAKPFDMAESFAPAATGRKFLTGTQPIISLATMEVGIDIALSVDEAALRAKSLELTSLFIQLVEERIPNSSLTLITPRDHAERGSHVSFQHPEGYAVMQALIERGVIGDYREPEVLRFGITPLYLGYADVWDAVETLREVLAEEPWNNPEFQLRGAVT
ncbi:kynureninase [Leucobacter coleopterorum]|uniref:Kynureninase n=1 Tax=Leucobacter coleopterorum TaxID=2714933 RepID=A0ABX6JXJ9_9MICO|nr:kynureninase [Leucobacter coleopterorum]QIM18977.1 kynureninase [Leucobacter coleopterorum]